MTARANFPFALVEAYANGVDSLFCQRFQRCVSGVSGPADVKSPFENALSSQVRIGLRACA